MSSPRPWGCFPSSSAWWKAAGVFPTPVGVFLLSLLCQTLCLCLPHARGGVSNAMNLTTRELQSSPRPWGCFRHQHQRRPVGMVFPTPVGVFPRSCRGCRCHGGLPHARGGGAVITQRRRRWLGSSPRPWGCFQQHEGDCGASWVFPTPVGVFPGGQCCLMLIRGLPHARGGVSPSLVQRNAGALSSPRPWGCFQNYQRRFCNHPVFPTPVGSPPYTTSVGSVDCDGHGQVNTGQPAPPANE